MITIAQIDYSKDEEGAVLKVLRSGQLSQGKTVWAFEEQFANYIGTRYAIAVSSGTAALEVSIGALGLSTGNEIITTPFSFFASTGAILSAGATPLFVDIKDDCTIDEKMIERTLTKKTRAILPVHLFGKPSHMEVIMAIAKKHDLFVIEDACQAPGAEIQSTNLLINKSTNKNKYIKQENWKKVGSIGDMGCFSFYATKNMTTGEGGMITTNNPDVANKARALRSNGHNFKMTELEAALGLVQLTKLDSFNKKRRQNADYLSMLLRGVGGIQIPTVDPETKHVFHQYTIAVTKQFPASRDKLRSILNQKGVQTEVFYPTTIPQQLSKKTNNHYGQWKEAERACREVLSLPIHPGVTKPELEYITNIIKQI